MPFVTPYSVHTETLYGQMGLCCTCCLSAFSSECLKGTSLSAAEANFGILAWFFSLAKDALICIYCSVECLPKT